MTDDPTPPAPRRRLRLIDLSGLVVGFGLAALLMRGAWPGSKSPTGPVAFVAALEYLWLGMAMSGPVVLLFDGRSRPVPRPRSPRTLIFDEAVAEVPKPPPGRSRASGELPTSRYTKAELAWLSIGGYWIGMAAFVVGSRPVALPMPLFGLFQILAAIGLWVLVPKRRPAGETGPSWTHRAAVVLLSTWPLAWVAMILLSMA